MGFNIYKEMPKIKEYLKKAGYNDGDKIPVEVFGSSLMFIFGMKKETAVKWINEFETIKIISLHKGMVSFLGGDGS